MTLASVLPYRTDALALGEWLEARARGRSAEQLREAVDSPKGVEGTAAAAAALGFVDGDQGRLTELGERFVLADLVERRSILSEVVRGFGPYAAVFTALEVRGAVAETEVRWIEALWATRGFGSSESNRREGGAAFGRLVDFCGLGEYVPGRRGRPTRIRWSADRIGGAPPAPSGVGGGRASSAPAPDLFTAPAEPPVLAAASGRASAAAAAAAGPSRPTAPPSGAPTAGEGAAPPIRRRDPSRVSGRQPSEVAVNRITIPLAGDAMARLEVPLRLPAVEKRRLLDLLELLIREE